ncbi:MAG: OmpA family protein [Fibrobacter sp.]|nr:OmpA family protein [Fibrobacter sp.]
MKRIVTGLALALAMSAFAEHPQTINKDGFVGVNKTQSAQSLGHAKLVFFGLGDATFGNDMFPIQDPGGYSIYKGVTDADGKNVNQTVNDFTGLTMNTGFAIGIWDYFDVGVTIPVHYDQFKIGENGDMFKIGYIGNVRGDVKIRFPLPDYQPMDIAIFGGASFGTADKTKQGLWVREAEYINNATGEAFAFGTKNTTMKFGLAVTADFSKNEDGDGFPFLLYLNGGYRYTTNDDYISLPFVSAAADVYFMDFLSLFVEYYWDIQLDKFTIARTGEEQNLDMKQLSGAIVFHLPVGLDIHLGASYYLGGDNYVYDAKSYQSHEFQEAGMTEKANGVTLVGTRVNPEYTVYGGLTWSHFLVPQDRDGDGVEDGDDKCPDDYGHKLNQGCPLGNPDPDEDGVCDAWVEEKGYADEFADVCEGVDECPNEPGEDENGCPLDNPDPDGDGVCDAWVSQKNMLKKFKGICEGIDECPTKKGTVESAGCPEDDPDPDADGVCSPWVTDKGQLKKFAGKCKGYDMCPGEPGAMDNKGCPWEDPDSDGDGLCDQWVFTQKKAGIFEKALTDEKIAKKNFITKGCKGLDKCEAEFGPASNDGCPLGDPDTDKDGVCDPWVTEKKLLDQYDGICAGVDKCPTEPGDLKANGCPMESPDPDGDSICSPWVTKKKMLDQFKDVCTGYDRCEDEPGPAWNKGCPNEDDPDADKDGVCSEWVSIKKLQKEFEGVCTGIDRCPDIAGDDGFGCPKKAVEKLDGVTFKSGKATLESNAKNILKKVAKKLTSEEDYKNLQIVIQGHTDNQGKEKTNQKLSQQRAESVMKELVKGGVEKKRIKAVGLGSSCPVDDNSTADGREMNRRIEMHFVTADNDGTKCDNGEQQ